MRKREIEEEVIAFNNENTRLLENKDRYVQAAFRLKYFPSAKIKLGTNEKLSGLFIRRGEFFSERVFRVRVEG